MINNVFRLGLCVIIVLSAACVQSPPEGEKIVITAKSKGLTTAYGPNRITRNIIQDKKGNIWMAAFDGIFKYDGKAFTNVTSKVTTARFFSILEDRQGNLWFGSIGSGVYRYNGSSYQHYTTREGLLNNDVTSIFEDRKGNIWFGVFGGASCFDGQSFRNYVIDENDMHEDSTKAGFTVKPRYEVTSVIEDKTGKLWFATRGRTFTYNGKMFTVITHNGKPFKNVRSIIKDKRGNIWLGGEDGLWRYNGSVCTNFTHKFTGHVMEDKKGNIWTSSEKIFGKQWVLSRYDEGSLSNKKPNVTEIAHEPLIFGILEDDKQNIWFGSIGAQRYDRKVITRFINKANPDYSWFNHSLETKALR
jgi:ligand-binding sensor domain-containing protein